jgi:hypothetical protein
MPSVMPVTAGTIAALATEVATCDAATAQKPCDSRMITEADTTAMPGTMTQARLLFVASMKPPIGVMTSMPATLPSVMADPIRPLAQPCDCRNTPTNGPIPDCMSAMKKFNASSGQSRIGSAGRAVFLRAGMTKT